MRYEISDPTRFPATRFPAKLRPRLLLAGLLLAVVAFSAAALDLPAPPAGYSWQECADIKGALLVPKGWHFLRVEEGEKLAYFITPERWQPPRQLTLGLTFNVLPEVPAASPSAFGKRYVREMADATGSQQVWDRKMGPFVGHGIIYSDGASQFYNLILANDATGTAYLVIFEAPLDRWQRAWNKIEPVIQQMMIDDEV